MRVEKKTVTPRMAKAWLLKNIEINRPPKHGKIPMYARDMTEGRWQSETGETIKFDTEGRLIDGQNRLRAVVLANVPIEFHVAYDVPVTAFGVLDTGSARTAADTNAIAPITAAIVRWVIMWDHGHYTGSGIYKPTPTEIGDRYRAEPDEFAMVTRRAGDCQRARAGNGSAVGTAYYLFARIDVEQAATFFDYYLSGANLDIQHPILVLSKKISRAGVDRLTRVEQLSLFVRAWNFYRRDEPIGSLPLSAHKLTDANFPQPK